MMNLTTIALDSFLLLRRDKIFLPAAVGGLGIAILANLASDWSIEGFIKILFDIGTFGYHFIGSIVAIFWGTKLIADAKSEGAIEVQLASPIPRPIWIIGKYLGLVISLVFLGIILLAIWQGIMLINDFGMMTLNQLATFMYLSLAWMVLGAVSIFFSTFSGQATALFSSFSVWIVGLVISLINGTLPPDSPQFTKSVIGFFATFWNLQRFNFSDKIGVEGIELSSNELFWSAAYGIALIVVFIFSAGLIFRNRDLTS